MYRMEMIDFLESWIDDLCGKDTSLCDVARQRAEIGMAGVNLRRLRSQARPVTPKKWTGRIGHGRRGVVGQTVVYRIALWPDSWLPGADGPVSRTSIHSPCDGAGSATSALPRFSPTGILPLSSWVGRRPVGGRNRAKPKQGLVAAMVVCRPEKEAARVDDHEVPASQSKV